MQGSGQMASQSMQYLHKKMILLGPCSHDCLTGTWMAVCGPLRARPVRSYDGLTAGQSMFASSGACDAGKLGRQSQNRGTAAATPCTAYCLGSIRAGHAQ